MAKRAPKAAPDAPLVLTPPPAKGKKKSAKRSLSNKKNSHRRVRDTPIVASMRMVEGVGFVLDVDDVLTKNERYRLISVPIGRGKTRASTVESELADEFKEAVKVAAVKCCGAGILLEPGIRKGTWHLDIVSVWPTQRHHKDGTLTANGDADAPVAMVKDALQHAGVLDDDMRIVSGTERSTYEKGIRRTVAILRPVNAGEHDAVVGHILFTANHGRAPFVDHTCCLVCDRIMSPTKSGRCKDCEVEDDGVLE